MPSVRLLPLFRFIGARRRAGRRAWRDVQQRHPALAHLIRAGERYQRADGRRLAAAVTYYGFFAAFALGLLGFSILGYVLDEPTIQAAVQRFLDEHLPRMDTSALRDARHAVGLIAFVSLTVVGLLWVDSLRSSVRAIWQIEEYPGGFVVRWFIDGLALTGLGLLLVVSQALAFGAEALLGWILSAATPEFAPARWLLAAVRFGLGFGVNTLLAIAVLTLLPRLRMPTRRVLLPAILIAVGVVGLTSVGRLVVDRAESNPAFQVVAGAAGLLVFLLILNQLILFAAALTATGTAGRVVDLATGRVVNPAPSSAAPSPAAADPGASPATDRLLSGGPAPDPDHQAAQRLDQRPPAAVDQGVVLPHGPAASPTSAEPPAGSAGAAGRYES